MTNWFIPIPEDFPSQRALLHLGLNSASRYYRELVVPGIGGAWFVRQLSWAVAGIALARECNHKPTPIANGIEALAGKLQWNEEQDEYKGRGVNAFKRDDGQHIWSFTELSNSAHYVQVTYRQSSVRALSGLGITAGTRFNSMVLTGIGEDLATTFLDQKREKKEKFTLLPALLNWIQVEKGVNATNFSKELVRTGTSDKEKEIIRNALISDSLDNLSDTNRRRILIQVFGGNSTRPPGMKVLLNKLKGRSITLCDDIETSLAFDDLLKNMQLAIYSVAELFGRDPALTLHGLLSDDQIKDLLEQVVASSHSFMRSKGKKHPDVVGFISEISGTSVSEKELLAAIVRRDGNVLLYSQDRILRGPLFDHRKTVRTVDESLTEEEGSEETSTGNKILQLFNLWRDCQ